jgi:hypothetical protein
VGGVPVDFLRVARRLVVDVQGVAPMPRAVIEAQVSALRRAGHGVLTLPRRLWLEEPEDARAGGLGAPGAWQRA